MLLSTVLIILGIGATLEVFFKNRKLTKLYYLLGLTICFIILGFNRWSHDYEEYLKLFQYDSVIKDFGFKTLVQTIKKMGGTYESVVFLIGILFFLVGLKIMHKKNINLFLLLYFIYPFPIEISQSRNLIMFLFFFLGILNLKSILGLIYIIIGSLFHSVGIVFIPFYFFKNYSEKNFKIIVIIMSVMLTLGIKFIVEIAKKFQIEKILVYYRPKNILNLSFLYHICSIIVFIVILKNIRKYLYEESEEDKFFIKLFYYPIIFIPLFYFFSEFSRIYRNIYVVNIYYICQKMTEIPKLKKKILCIFLLIYALISILSFKYSSGLEIKKSINTNLFLKN